MTVFIRFAMRVKTARKQKDSYNSPFGLKRSLYKVPMEDDVDAKETRAVIKKQVCTRMMRAIP